MKINCACHRIEAIALTAVSDFAAKEKNPVRRNQSVKAFTTMIVGGLIVLSLLLFTTSVRSVTRFARANDNAGAQSQRKYSDLQNDELSLTTDVKLLRRDLRRGASGIAVAKDRNFVRQDLLNIVLDRWQPAEEAQDLERDQDLASLIGELFAGPAQELIRNLEPASRS